MENQVPYTLIAKHLAGESKAEEDAQLWEWLDAAPEHALLFQQCLESYQLGMFQISEAKIDQKLQRIIPLSKPSHYWKWFAGLAAALALLFFGVQWFNHQSNYIIMSTLPGQVKEIWLADSSRIILNGNSSIHYHQQNFTTQRSIHLLYGEVYIEVKKDQEHSFTILYDSISASLESGELMVQLWPERSINTAFVTQGTVYFQDHRVDGSSLQLNSGYQVDGLKSYGLLSSETIGDINYNSWLSGYYIFNQTPVKQVVEYIKKDRGIQVKINEEKLSNQTITGIYTSDSTEHFLHFLADALQATIQVNDPYFTLTKN